MATTLVRNWHPSVIEATELPKLIRLTDNLYVAAFALMKLLPARYILDQARATGELAPGDPVIETSSGTFGLGLALVCRRWGHPLTIVGDAAIDDNLRNRLEMLGARVELVQHRDAPGGIQGARLARVAQLRARQPESFVPNQYDNPANQLSYEVVGEQVEEALGAVDCLVGPVGSGGSTGGLAAALRHRHPALRLLGVDTHGSVIFGLADGRRLLRGLGSSVHPGNVRYEAYDEVHWVSAPEAFRATRELYRAHGLFMGPTSGAAFLVACWWAVANPQAKVLAILPDEGHRYQDTVYNAAWLHSHGVAEARRRDRPVVVSRPSDVDGGWSCLQWGRRTLSQVLAAGAAR